MCYNYWTADINGIKGNRSAVLRRVQIEIEWNEAWFWAAVVNVNGWEIGFRWRYEKRRKGKRRDNAVVWRIN